MNQLSIWVFITITLLGCSEKNNDDLNTHTSDIAIGTTSYRISNPFSINENCGYLFMKVIPTSKNNFPYIFNIKLSKKGDIVKISLADNAKNYESSIFNPTESLTISSFQFDSLTGALSFDLNGKLFEPYTTSSETIKCSFKNLQVAPTICSAILPNLEADIKSNSGRTERFFSSIATSEGNSQSHRHYFYSNNGYQIILENNSGFKDISAGTFDVSSESAFPFKIIFRKYLGFSDKNNFYLYVDKEWQSYTVVGKAEILAPIIQKDGTKLTNGKLTFTAYNDNKDPIYFFTNGNLAITDNW